MLKQVTSVPLNKIEHPVLTQANVQLDLLREDLIHPDISGNKYRKLFYNIQEFLQGSYTKIVTFGGIHSNHIAATAAIGKELGIPTQAFIRGERIASPTLYEAERDGMSFEFIDRANYKDITQNNNYHKLQLAKDAYLIPEGGANLAGIKGCAEIVSQHKKYELFVCAVGTGGTLSGIISGMEDHQHALGISVLKNAFGLNDDVEQNLQELSCSNKNWNINHNFHLGGYAKNNKELCEFIGQFYKEQKIKLDPIYTGKMLFALFQLCREKVINNCTVCAIHTGGLQGVKAFESRYKKTLFT